jgi:hypothetical protein
MGLFSNTMPCPDVDSWETRQSTYSRTRPVLDRFSSELHALFLKDKFSSSDRINAALDGEAQVAGSEGSPSWTDEPSGISGSANVEHLDDGQLYFVL